MHPRITVIAAVVSIIVGIGKGRLLARDCVGCNAAKVFAVAGIILGLQTMACVGYAKTAHYLKLKAWLAKDASAGLTRVDKGRVAEADFQGHPIDLKPYLNLKLNQPFFNRLQDDSFTNLPSGHQVFGGIPFDVDGIIVLRGDFSTKCDRDFPAKVDIRVAQKCQKLYLLHGMTHETTSQSLGKSIAKITLKYADHSDWEVDIQNGVNVASWYGGPGMVLKDTRTKLAWVGTNQVIRLAQAMMPGLMLRIWQTEIVNPYPELEVTSLTYESCMLDPSPFLIAVTLE